MTILGSKSFARWQVALVLVLVLEIVLETEIELELVLEIEHYCITASHQSVI